jgi:hypothetical protein
VNAESAGTDVVARRNELELEIARLVADAPAPGWNSLKLVMKCVGKVQGGLIFMDRKGTEEREFPPRSSYRRFRELKDIMFREGHGTWFSMTVELEHDGHMSATYNYDEEPAWDVPIGDGEYAVDLERYPRSPEHIPAWLQEKLSAGAKR